MLEVKNLCVKRRQFVMKDLSFEVQDGEFFVLLGPTGAGKTVLLESIAGLKPIESGQILINGRDVTSFGLEARNIGIAYQDYVLFHHLSVWDNISFGLTWKRKSAEEIHDAIAKAVELLGLEDQLEKHPWVLSGGESQKVSLARAIAIKPDVLLLDEPLSAIDPETKETMERELREVHDKLKLPTIHVTHNFEEAMALADRIAVIGEGSIRQIATPEEIFRHPNSEFVARFFLSRNIFTGEAIDGRDGKGAFAVEGARLATDTTLRGWLHASVRPEEILVSMEPPQSSALNSLHGTITQISDRGWVVYVTVTVPPAFTCVILHPTLAELGLREGQRVYISFESSAVNVF